MATTRTDEDVTHGRHKPIKRKGHVQVICTMDVKRARSSLASFLVLEENTGLMPSQLNTLRKAWQLQCTEIPHYIPTMHSPSMKLHPL